MSIALRTNGTSRTAPRDPFAALARDLFSWDPFIATTGRTASAFAPSFEVKETAEAFVVRADVPGVAEGDLDLSVHNGVLSVSGRRHSEERKENENYYLAERLP